MSQDAMLGMIGGAIGCIIGLCGGLIGTYFSIKNTKGPKERRFMVRWAIGFWIAMGVFLGLMVLLPSPYRYYLWAPYGVLLPLAIISCNRGQARIQAEEAERDE